MSDLLLRFTPIAEALPPCDGDTEVVLWPDFAGDKIIGTCWIDSDGDYRYTDGDGRSVFPTHWHPTAPAPEQ